MDSCVTAVASQSLDGFTKLQVFLSLLDLTFTDMTKGPTPLGYDFIFYFLFVIFSEFIKIINY